ncbi:hypothetical protein B0H13DRAFT_2345857 [Mycena leptocephala]|nr:hypothetical protein B0H13DRAFT_2345857 [Mycena leptocephala]
MFDDGSSSDSSRANSLDFHFTRRNSVDFASLKPADSVSPKPVDATSLDSSSLDSASVHSSRVPPTLPVTDADLAARARERELAAANADGRLREAPTLQATLDALKDIGKVLRPPRKKGYGYIDPKLDPFTRSRIEGIQSLLALYTNPSSSSYGKWKKASINVAITMRRGNYCARVVRRLTRQYITDRSVLLENPTLDAPRKTLKPSEGTFQLPDEPNTPPDETPVNDANPPVIARCQRARPRRPVTDGERVYRPLPYRVNTASRAPSSTPASPPPHSEADDADVEMSDDDMNGINGGGTPTSLLNPAPLNPAPADGHVPSAGDGNQPPPPPPVVPFAMPEEEEIAAEVPSAQGENLYLKQLPPQPGLPIDADLGRASFQHSAGQFPAHIITNTAALAAIAPQQLKGHMKKPGHKFVAVVANGGNFVLNDTPHGIPLELEVTNTIPDPDLFHGGKYGGPRSMLVLVEDDAGAATISGQTACGVHEAFGCWLHDIDANKNVRKWPVGFWGLATIPRNTLAADIEASTRGAFLTQADGGDPRRRVFDALNTIHFQYLPHHEKPVVAYLKPPTEKEEDLPGKPRKSSLTQLRAQHAYPGAPTILVLTRSTHVGLETNSTQPLEGDRLEGEMLEASMLCTPSIRPIPKASGEHNPPLRQHVPTIVRIEIRFYNPCPIWVHPLHQAGTPEYRTLVRNHNPSMAETPTNCWNMKPQLIGNNPRANCSSTFYLPKADL